jgi:hypothetical protein
MLAVALALIAYCLILVGWFGSNTPGWVVGAVFIPWAMFMAFLGAYWFRVECKAFRLEDDGTCEFETRWRVMRTHVTQIKSVKESVDDEGDRSWDLRFRDRSLLLIGASADFDDFLSRIETMTPAIEIKRKKRRKPWRLRRR